MSRWLARALAEAPRATVATTSHHMRGGITHESTDLPNPHGGLVPKLPKCPKFEPEGVFGNFGNFGTAPLIEIEERIAMTLEGGVPALYAEAFAHMQATRPDGMSSARWGQAVNDAGLFLDAHGAAAAALGWRVEDLFAPAGLVWALAGETVTCLSSSQAVLSDGRTIAKDLRFFERDVVL
jgi:hypothetical protein